MSHEFGAAKRMERLSNDTVESLAICPVVPRCSRSYNSTLRTFVCSVPINQIATLLFHSQFIFATLDVQRHLLHQQVRNILRPPIRRLSAFSPKLNHQESRPRNNEERLVPGEITDSLKRFVQRTGDLLPPIGDAEPFCQVRITTEPFSVGRPEFTGEPEGVLPARKKKVMSASPSRRHSTSLGGQ